jgi:hypothetical protein
MDLGTDEVVESMLDKLAARFPDGFRLDRAASLVVLRWWRRQWPNFFLPYRVPSSLPGGAPVEIPAQPGYWRGARMELDLPPS